MSSKSNRRGRFGENYTAAWLQAKGAQVLEKNWRCREGEVDIIARMGEFICFVEVKARRQGPALPEEAVGRSKRRRMLQSAQQYLLSHPESLRLQPRFDVAALILGKGEEPEVTGFSYLPGAFTCDDL